MANSIKTDRLILRRPVAADTAAIAVFMQEKSLPWNLGRAPWPYEESDAAEWLALTVKQWSEGAEYPYMITLADTEMLIGSCGLTRITDCIFELGYWIGKPHWGHGYVTEASAALLAWARTSLGATGFISGHIEDNSASGRVLEKLGFSRVGTAQMYARGRGGEVTAVRYALDAPAKLALKSSVHG
ncbi:MAG: GNAT family N-acetyltransferase [Pseudomonadota bacterium]